MNYIKKFNENFSGFTKITLSDVPKVKAEIYQSMNPPMVEVYEDWSDYLLELTDEYDEVTSPYGDVRDIIDIHDLELVINMNNNEEYAIACEKDYIWVRGKMEEMDPRDIPIEKKLSHYGSDYDKDFMNYYNRNSGKVNPYYSFLIGFDSDYKDGRRSGWSDDDIKQMTDELVVAVKRCMKRLSAEIVKLQGYDGEKWVLVNSKNLDDIKYPRFKLGFKVTR